jgi:peptide/nickel transport system substrate-binding protein
VLLAVSLGACTNSRRISHREDTLVIAIDSSPTNLDPRIGIDKASENFHHLMFNGLLRKDEHDRMVPDLALSYERINPLLYRFRLRSGVSFHNGKRLSAADVVFTFNSILRGEVSTTRRAALESVESVTAVAPDLVEIRLKERFNSLPINLSVGIIPAGSPPDFAQNPIGTGPYRLIDFQPDSMARFSAFPHYFEGPPKLDFLVLRVIPDSTTRALELKRGSVDLVLGAGAVPPDYFEALKKDADLKTATGTGNNYAYIGMNLRDPLLEDRRVRQAIGYAIDRNAIIHSLMHGTALPATGILAPYHWCYEPDVLHLSYDRERSKKLLDQAGYGDPDGDGPAMRFTIEYKTTTSEFRRLVATVIQSQLQRVGIGVDVRSYEWGTFFSDINRGNFQLCMLLWVGESDPDILREVFSSAGMRNRGKYHDLSVDQWLSLAKTAETEEQQKRYYSLVQKKVAEDCPYISLWYESAMAVMRKELAGLRLTPDSDFRVLKDVYWTNQEDSKTQRITKK